MVSMKTGQFYFKLSVKRIVSMTMMSFGLDNEKVGSKVEVNLELQGMTDKLSRLNAVVDIEETLNEEESKRLESVVEPSSISSSSLPISSDDCSFNNSMDDMVLCADEFDGIHVVPGTKRTPAKGKSRIEKPGKRGKSASQQTIALVSQGSNSSDGCFVRSPQKRGKFIRTGGNKKVSNVYSVRIKNSEFLLVFAEDGRRQFIYHFPGTQLKSWCTAFERDLRQEQAWPTGESPILNIVRRRDIRENDGDVPLAQINASQYVMHAYLCYIGPDDTPASISEAIVAKINEYQSANSGHMKHFRYWHEITDGHPNEMLNSLDYWVITKDIVDTINDAYDEELQEETIWGYHLLLDGLFERPENTRDLRATLAGLTFRGNNV